jgi:hypothetical protein
MEHKARRASQGGDEMLDAMALAQRQWLVAASSCDLTLWNAKTGDRICTVEHVCPQRMDARG